MMDPAQENVIGGEANFSESQMVGELEKICISALYRAAGTMRGGGNWHGLL